METLATVLIGIWTLGPRRGGCDFAYLESAGYVGGPWHLSCGMGCDAVFMVGACCSYAFRGLCWVADLVCCFVVGGLVCAGGVGGVGGVGGWCCWLGGLVGCWGPFGGWCGWASCARGFGAFAPGWRPFPYCSYRFGARLSGGWGSGWGDLGGVGWWGVRSVGRWCLWGSAAACRVRGRPQAQAEMLIKTLTGGPLRSISRSD